MSETPLGRFCWFELMTTDPRAATSFYRANSRMETQEWDGPGETPYTMWMNGETPIGGVMRLPDEAAAAGAPPHWLPYVSTPDLDVTLARAQELGAEALMGPMDIPTVGRIVVLRDPQGAVFSPYQPEGETPGNDEPAKLGEFSWHELVTDDWEAAFGFYSELFGWEKADAMDMGPAGMYQMYHNGAHPIGGMFKRPPEVPVSNWLLYALVADAAAAAAKVNELGGQVLNGPMEVPGGGMIAQCMDPQGAAFAVHANAMES